MSCSVYYRMPTSPRSTLSLSTTTSCSSPSPSSPPSQQHAINIHTSMKENEKSTTTTIPSPIYHHQSTMTSPHNVPTLARTASLPTLVPAPASAGAGSTSLPLAHSFGPLTYTENTSWIVLISLLIIYVGYLIVAIRGWPEGLVSINITMVVILCGIIIWRYAAFTDTTNPSSVAPWYVHVTWFGVGCAVGIPLIGTLVLGMSYSSHNLTPVVTVIGYMVLGVVHAMIIQFQAQTTIITAAATPSSQPLLATGYFSTGITISTLFALFTVLVDDIPPSPSDRLFQVSLITLIGVLSLFPLDIVCTHVVALRATLHINSISQKWMSMIIHALLRGSAIIALLHVINIHLSSLSDAPITTSLWIYIAVVWATLIPLCWYGRSLHRQCFSTESQHSSIALTTVDISAQA